jgi:DNA-binding NarL/FixJ family response regulator
MEERCRMTARLLIVDDQEMICSGLRALLSGTSVEIVGCATTAAEARRCAVETAPDVALVDIVLGDRDGFELAEQFREIRPGMAIVFYTAFDNPRFAARAAALGAAGVVSKGEPCDVLVAAIESAASGRAARARRPAQRSGGNSEEVHVHLEVALTDREQQVLAKLAEGLTNKQIAQVLAISYETVKEHVQHILQKIGVADRTQAAVWAVRRQVI